MIASFLPPHAFAAPSFRRDALIFFSDLTNPARFSTINILCLSAFRTDTPGMTFSEQEVRRMKEKLRLTQMTTAAG